MEMLRRVDAVRRSVYRCRMSTFEVVIGEVATEPAPVSDRGSTPEMRSVYWRGEAADEPAARALGYEAWDAKYGAGRQPVGALVAVTPVDE
jgi:hypothetical protein